MKKSYIIIGFILIVIIFSVYWVFNLSFPVAKPIEYPNVEQINSINISAYNVRKDYIDVPTITTISKHIVNGRATRNWTVNDSPTDYPYYTVKVHTTDNTYTYYIYEKSPMVYIEKPYYGIYAIDKKIVNFIK